MLPKDHGSLSTKQAAQFGMPDGFKVYSPFPFAGMNQQASRVAIDDKEFFLRENFIRIGDGKLRTLWDIGPALYTAPTGKTIISYFFFNIGAVNYVAIFLNDGTGVQVDTATGVQIVMSSVIGTFYQTGFPLPACSQWGALYLLIANRMTPNSYWIWDGTILYFAGTLGPSVNITSGGSGYSSDPTVTAFGGSGSGVVANATIANGSVVNVVLTNPGMGYLPGDNVQFLFTGGGTDNGAELVAVLNSGTLSSIELLTGGSSYTSPVVSFINAGGHASATAHLTTNTVTSITPNTGGVYTSAPTVVISGGGGSGATATAVLTGSAVTSFVITNAGTGYTSTPTVSFFGGGNATASAAVSSGVITGIVVTNHGTGFSGSPQVVITDSTGSGATAIALLSPGGVSAVNVINGGTNFTATPTLTFEGGGGTGAAATAIITAGVITSVTVTAPGSGYTSAPAVVVQTGINNAASATATLMPFGVSGSTIETFQTRVWLAFPNQTGNQTNGGTILVSAPDSVTDFATSDGGLTYVSTDPFLRSQYTNLKQSNGYLYPIADSSVDVISNVQTTGSTPTTTFNYQNTDPQIGTVWRDTCVDYSRTILLANPLGVYGLYGGSVTKISEKMDDIFTNFVSPANGGLTPSCAIANIFSKKVFLMLMTIKDPDMGATRNVMIAWDEKDWFISSQSANLTYISTQEVDSNITAWGTDGTNLFPMFSAPSTNLSKKLSTKLFGAEAMFLVKQAMALYVQAQDNSTNNAGITFSTATIDTELGSYPVPNKIVFAPVSVPTVPPQAPLFPTQSGDVPGINLGFTLASSSPDFSLINTSLGYVYVSGVFGSTNLAGSQGE